MDDFVRLFRDSSPYINSHQGRTFVLSLDGETMASQQLPAIISDIALLNSLGVRLVVVTGAQTEMDDELRQRRIECSYHNGHMITTDAVLKVLQSVAGQQRIKLESLLSMGLPNTPMHNANIQVTSGNYVVAKPLGVIDGQDYAYTGTIRHIRANAIQQHLKADTIVHLPCLGYSITGEVFNLTAEEVATTAAIALEADKLIVMSAQSVLTQDGELVSEFSRDELQNYMGEHTELSAPAKRRLESILSALCGGTHRCHLLNYHLDGVLLQELFTHQGCGLQISLDRSRVRSATPADIGGILELIVPLEEQGILIRRSRAQIEQDIDRFMITELDGLVTGCGALFSVPGTDEGELACLATHPDYQSRGDGEALLAAIERAACMQQLKQLYVQTTQAMHWFIAQGFVLSKPSAEMEYRLAKGQAPDVPPRRSKVLIKSLKGLKYAK